VTGDLNVDLVRRPIVAHDDLQAGHSFPPDDADLDARLASAVGDHGREAGFDRRSCNHPPYAIPCT
jgi:hypothetical protein